MEKKDPYTILVDTPELSAKQILDAAKRGDRLALDAVEVLGKALGSALAAVAEVIDPEAFVIGRRNRRGGRDHPAYRTEVLQTRCTAGRCGHSV